MSFDTDIVKFIGLPESNKLIYEALLPSTNEIGNIISGFANTEGGILFLGILNKNRRITLTGLSSDFNVEYVVNNAIIKLEPQCEISSGFIDYDGKKIFALKVSKSPQLTAYDKICYQIVEKKVVKMNNNKVGVSSIESKLDKILHYLASNKKLHNVNKHTVKTIIFGDQVSLSEADELIERIKRSGYVKVYNDKYIGHSIDTEHFLQKGGYSNKMMNSSKLSQQLRIFISYNWGLKESAQNLFEFLTSSGFSVSMDDHDLSYKDKISTFMESIRQSDFAILLISDEYLKSANCMTEVLHVLKDRDCQHKILPVRHKNASFFKIADRLSYVSYWDSQVNDIRAHISKVDIASAIDEIKNLKTAQTISQEINGFLALISDMIILTIEEQEANSYAKIMNYIRSH